MIDLTVLPALAIGIGLWGGELAYTLWQKVRRWTAREGPLDLK